MKSTKYNLKYTINKYKNCIHKESMWAFSSNELWYKSMRHCIAQSTLEYKNRMHVKLI